jgi:hypothetical protein
MLHESENDVVPVKDTVQVRLFVPDVPVTLADVPLIVPERVVPLPQLIDTLQPDCVTVHVDSGQVPLSPQAPP